MLQSILQLMDQNSIAKMFLLVIAIIGILNAAKHYLIWQYKKKLIQPEICDYLKNIGNMAECTHQKYKDKYIMSENSCRGCRGKTVANSTERAEMYTKSQGKITSIIIVCANLGTALLPYLSILFTLIVAAFVTAKTKP